MLRRLEFLIYALVIIGAIILNARPDENGAGNRARNGERRPSPPSMKEVSVKAPSDGLEWRRTFAVNIDARTSNGAGTGFLVSDKGRVVTARHVVDGCKAVYVRFGDGKYRPASGMIVYKGVDFATLLVPEIDATPLDLSLSKPRRGMFGYMSGYPQGKPADIRARVIGYNTMVSRGRYQAREKVTTWVEVERRPNFMGSIGGISGGPVFGANGQVIGTVVAGSMRRGRVHTTDPSFFDRSGLFRENEMADRRLRPNFKEASFDKAGQTLRRNLNIVQVYCRAF